MTVRPVTRFAPSPTGDLHLGGAWTALASWALARAAGGVARLRIEDIDTPRVAPGSAARIQQDLAWLGLDWDGPAVVQSERLEPYARVLAQLDAQGLTYLCDCSRAEIARAASAPHAGEEGEGALYPGTCRNAPPGRVMKRSPAVRLRVPRAARVAFEDCVRGPVEQDVARAVGDFVLRRGDGVFAYQLVVAIDDADMHVTHVVRADDLLASTARQLLLLRLLGKAHVPRYAHVPLVVDPDGQRLAKRTRGATVRDLATAGVDARVITGTLAHGLGLVPSSAPAELAPREVADLLTPPSSWRKEPWPIPRAWTSLMK